MDLKTYLKVSAINLIFLLLGLLLGIGLRTETPAVHAQAKQAQTTDSVSTRDGVSTKVTLDPNAEYVSPGVSLGGPVVTNTLLANRIGFK
jgi:hypothetical protein